MYKQRRKHDCTNDTKPKNKHVIIPINIEPEIISKKKNTPKIKYQHLIVIALILSCIVLFILFNINKTNQNYLDKVKNQQYPSMNETLTMVESQLNISKSINNREILAQRLFGIENNEEAYKQHQQMIDEYHSFSLPPLYPDDLPKSIALAVYKYHIPDEADKQKVNCFAAYTDYNGGQNYQTNPIVYKAFGTLKVTEDGSEKSVYNHALGIIPDREHISKNGYVTPWPHARVSDQAGKALSNRKAALIEDPSSSKIGMTTLVSIDVNEYNKWVKFTTLYTKANGLPDLFVAKMGDGIHIIAYPYKHPSNHNPDLYSRWQIPPSFINIIANIPNRAIEEITGIEQKTPGEIKAKRDEYCNRVNAECESNELDSALDCCKEARWCNDDIGYEVETKKGFKDEPEAKTSTTKHYDPVGSNKLKSSARKWKQIEDNQDDFLVIHSSWGMGDPFSRCTKLLTMERQINGNGLKSEIQYKIYHNGGFENYHKPTGIWISFYGGIERKGEFGDRDYDPEALSGSEYRAAHENFIVYMVYADLRGNVMDRVTDLAWFTYNLKQNTDKVMWPFDVHPNELKIIGNGESHGGLTGALVVTEEFNFWGSAQQITGKDMYDAYILNAAYINPSKETCDIGGCALSRIRGRYLEKFIGKGFGMFTNCRQIVDSIKWNQLSVEILNVHNLKDKNVSPRTMLEMLTGVLDADKWRLYNFVFTSYEPAGDKKFEKSHFYDEKGLDNAFSWVNTFVIEGKKNPRDDSYKHFLVGIKNILEIRNRYDPVYKWSKYPHIQLLFYTDPQGSQLQQLRKQSYHFIMNFYQPALKSQIHGLIAQESFDECLTNPMQNTVVDQQRDAWRTANDNTQNISPAELEWLDTFSQHCRGDLETMITRGMKFYQFTTSCVDGLHQNVLQRMDCLLKSNIVTSFYPSYQH